MDHQIPLDILTVILKQVECYKVQTILVRDYLIISDPKYLEFSLRVAEEVIRKRLVNVNERLYDLNKIVRLFSDHIEANKWSLEMDKMLKQIQKICMVLDLPPELILVEFIEKTDNKVKSDSSTEFRCLEATVSKSCQCIPSQEFIESLNSNSNECVNVLNQEETHACERLLSSSNIDEISESTTKESNNKVVSCKESLILITSSTTSALPKSIANSGYPSLHCDESNCEIQPDQKQLTENCPLNFLKSIVVVMPDCGNQSIQVTKSDCSPCTKSENPSCCIKKINPNEQPYSQSSRQMQALEVTEESSLTIRGPNNEQLEYTLIPGTIYVPKEKNCKICGEQLKIIQVDTVDVSAPSSNISKPSNNNTNVPVSASEAFAIMPDPQCYISHTSSVLQYASSKQSTIMATDSAATEMKETSSKLVNIIYMEESEEMVSITRTTDQESLSAITKNNKQCKCSMPTGNKNYSLDTIAQFYPDNSTQTDMSGWNNSTDSQEGTINTNISLREPNCVLCLFRRSKRK